MKRPLLLVLLVLLAACARSGDQPVSAFDGRVADWTAQLATDSPELATRAGLTEQLAGRGFAARLDDRSAAADERRRAAAERRLVELRVIDAEKLSGEARVTYDVLDAQFEAAAGGARFAYGRFGALDGVSPYVLNQLDSAFLDLPDFLDSGHVIANFQDAENYLARLRAVATAIDAETERARADAGRGVIPPDFIIDRTIQQLDGIAGTGAEGQIYVTSFAAKLSRLAPPAAEGDEGQRNAQRAQRLTDQAIQITRERIIPAHARAAAFLRSIRPRATHDAGVWRLPDGPAFYRAALRIETTSTLSPGEIHQIGLARVRTISQELDLALRRMGRAEGAVGQRLAQLTADPQYQYPATDEGRARLIADVRARVAHVMELAPRWFERVPRATLEVRRVPTFAEAAASGAYYEAPALDGSTPGVYYINLRNLAEVTRIDLPTQDYHEAAPGHHFQIARARERTDLPTLRRLLSFTAYTEGWGLYAEQLADEQNLYARDPIGRIGYLRWQLWRAARLVVDTGMHEKRWSREQAIDYLSQTTGDTPGVIISEVERYAAFPGQACAYELGRREIASLREEARNRLGPDFELKGFHEAVLADAEVPFAVLRERVRAWIGKQGGES